MTIHTEPVRVVTWSLRVVAWQLGSAVLKVISKSPRTVSALGRWNHMRSFYGLLSDRGITYVPYVIDPSLLQAIVTSDYERGAVDENGDPLR